MLGVSGWMGIASADQTDQSNPRLASAAAMAARGNLDEAVRIYTSLLDAGWVSLDERERAHIGRGIVHFAKGEYDLAIADFSTAVALRPNDPEAYYDRGLAYRQKGAMDAALADYNITIRLSPRYGQAFNNRGYVYAVKGELDLAFADFEKAIALDPRLAEAYSNRGAIFSTRGHFDRAISDFGTSLRLDPNQARPHMNRAIAYFAKGDFRTALYDFQRAQSLDRNNSYRQLWLMLAQSKVGAINVDAEGPTPVASEVAQWPSPLLALFAGRESAQQILAMNGGAPVEREHTRECDTAFFVGEFELSHGQEQAGSELLHRAIEACPAFAPEAIAARSELARASR